LSRVTGTSSAHAQTIEIVPISLEQFENLQWFASSYDVLEIVDIWSDGREFKLFGIMKFKILLNPFQLPSLMGEGLGVRSVSTVQHKKELLFLQQRTLY